MAATAHKLRKALTTASTATSFTDSDWEATTTKPSGAGVWDLLDSSIGWGAGIMVPSYLKIIPYAVGTGTNDTFDFMVIGFNVSNDATPVYIPQTLLDATVTLGTDSGNDGAAIAATVQLAKSIVVNQGSADGAFRNVVSTADDGLPSHLLLHTRGCQYIKFLFDSTDAQATDMNCYIAPVS
jgi:hypothetical protein